MQEHQKYLKKSNKSEPNQKTHHPIDHINAIEGLLKIDFIQLPLKRLPLNQISCKDSRDATSRKSQKSLAINLEKLEKRTKDIKKQQKISHKLESAKVRKIETVKTTEKQTVQQNNYPTQRDKSSSVDAKESFEHDFVQKKMKVGQKFRGNAMKQFILQTLSKGKAEGTCLVIHKGTAQCSYSPINKNKSETSKHQKEEFPLILVQDTKKKAEKGKRANQSIFGPNGKKVNRSASTKSTAINLPSVNKKWVKMARQFEKKNEKAQLRESIIEVIEEKIQINEDQKSEQNEEIKQQILVSNNESLIKDKIKPI